MFRDVGVRVRVLWPGDPSALYHSEGVQEGFLVLSGECTLIVEEEERVLRQWDYFHCPADTRHAIVGGGDGPCAILMIGARPEVETIRYPVSEVAAKYGASVAKETDDPGEAYDDWPGEYLPVRVPWPLDSDTTPAMKLSARSPADFARVQLPLSDGHSGRRPARPASAAEDLSPRATVPTIPG